MCEYTALAYRRGTIVESLDGDENQNYLSVSQAQTVGQKIDGRIEEYINSSKGIVLNTLSEVFGGESQSLSVEFSQSRNQVSARFDPGLILDFPKITAIFNGRSVEIRSCVTVCVGDMRSKLWTRANTLDGWQTSLRTEFQSAHDMLKKICDGINDDIISKYEEDLTASIPISYLKPHGNIHVFAVDCEGSDISSKLEDINKSIISRRDRFRIVKESELASAFNEISDVFLHQRVESAKNNEFQLAEDEEFFPIQSDLNGGSVFIQQTSAKDAYFAGLVDGTDHSQGDRVLQNNPIPKSVGATAELAAFFGSAF